MSRLLPQRSLRASILALLIYVVVAVLTPDYALSFNSYPKGAAHDKITDASAKHHGLSKKTRKALKKATRAPDWNESSWDPDWWPWTWFDFSTNDNYRASHHFDRGPGVTDAAAFRSGADYIQQELNAAVAAAKAGNKDDAIAALGRTMHALQDFKSHSNYIDLAPADQAMARAALYDATKPLPGALKLTGYDPAAKNPGNPRGDPYPHDKFAKDSPKKNKECKKKVGNKTKYELARDSAIEESKDLLQRLKNELTVDQWNALIVAVIDPDPNDGKYCWARSEPCGSAGCVIDCLNVPAITQFSAEIRRPHPMQDLIFKEIGDGLSFFTIRGGRQRRPRVHCQTGATDGSKMGARAFRMWYNYLGQVSLTV
ncbi:MAG: hypothetical protein GTO29_11715 [Candidatus Latescibacteria bacterium]|nr:hypothetical protein [Candidatus Latescibacterota bacterium]NIO56833.1 hypothetical protein [Candidatus Latescibacterota bacterium]